MQLQDVGQLVLALQNKEVMQAIVNAINQADANASKLEALGTRLLKSAERETALREELEAVKRDHEARVSKMAQDYAVRITELEAKNQSAAKTAREENGMLTARVGERERQIRELEKRIAEMSDHPEVKAARAARVKAQMASLSAELKGLEPPPPPPPVAPEPRPVEEVEVVEDEEIKHGRARPRKY